MFKTREAELEHKIAVEKWFGRYATELEQELADLLGRKQSRVEKKRLKLQRAIEAGQKSGMDTFQLEFELTHLRLTCKHKNVTVHKTYQGGNKYFDVTTCHDCGKHGDRYNPVKTRKETRKRDKEWGIKNPTTEEEFLKMDKFEKEKIFDNRCW